MNLRLLALSALPALALLAYACSEETTVLPPNAEREGITVSGAGSVFGEPDVAVLTLGAEAEAPSVGAARAQATQAMDGMLSALRDGGVSEDDIQTSRFSVQPRYDLTREERVLRGFVVTNIVTAKVREIDRTGELLDAALEAGGDLARVESVGFTIDDPAQLEDEARRQAVDEARRKAETYADAAGAGVGRVLSISETGGPTPVFFEDAGRLAQEEPVTPIEPGQLEVRVQVQIVYELEQ